MLKVITVLTMSVIFVISCNPIDRKDALKETKDESIEYEGSRKYGNYINVVKSLNGVKIHYNLKISDDGDLQHILKYDQKYHGQDETNLNANRSLQLLVTDTSRVSGPNFFGHPINGYYTDTFLVNNVILDKQSKTALTPLLPEEKKLFALIDSLAKSNNIKYTAFDTSKILGWFKYVF